MMEYELPCELWYLVFCNLEPKDLLNLRAASKKATKLVESNPIWFDICYRNWYSKSQYPQGIHLDGSTSCFSLFLDHHKTDLEIERFIDAMYNTTSNEDFLKKYDEFLQRFSSSQSVPMLNRIRRDSTKNLTVRSYCACLLNVFWKMEAHVPNEEAKLNEMPDQLSDLESVFYSYGHLDTGFSDLFPYREIVLERVVKKVKDCWDPSVKYQANTKKVVMIIKKFYETIMEFGHSINSSQCSESCSILRIYSGEIVGHPTVVYSIFSKIASSFSLNVENLKVFMAVEDPDFPTGRSYIDSRFPDEVIVQNFQDVIHQVNGVLGSRPNLGGVPNITVGIDRARWNRYISQDILEQKLPSLYSTVLSDDSRLVSLKEIYPVCGFPYNLGNFNCRLYQHSVNSGVSLSDSGIGHSPTHSSWRGCESFSSEIQRSLLLSNFLLSEKVFRGSDSFRTGDLINHRNGYYGVIIGQVARRHDYYTVRCVGDESRIMSGEEMVKLDSPDPVLIKNLLADPQIGWAFKRFNEDTQKFEESPHLKRALESNGDSHSK